METILTNASVLIVVELVVAVFFFLAYMYARWQSKELKSGVANLQKMLDEEKDHSKHLYHQECLFDEGLKDLLSRLEEQQLTKILGDLEVLISQLVVDGHNADVFICVAKAIKAHLKKINDKTPKLRMHIEE